MYNFLPGIQVETVDGGLRAKRNPNAQSVLVIGTAGQGQGDSVYQVVDRPTAASEFGFGGTLIRGMEEVATYCDNIFLFRMGTKPATAKGLGKDTSGTPVAGFDVTFNGDRSTDCGTNYRVYCKDGILYIFNSQALVYANDTGVQVVDTGDCVVTGAGAPGKGLAIGTTKTWEGSVSLASLAGLLSGTAASVVSTLNGPFTVVAGVSDKLTLTVNGTDLPLITLAAGVGRTAAELALELNTAAGGSILATVVAGKLTISTLTAGLGATVQVKAGAGTTAAVLLGLDTVAHTGTAPDANKPNPVFDATGVDGLGQTTRQTYVSLMKALELLEIFPIQHVYCPNAFLDVPTVALGGNTSDPNVLDWLKTSKAADGHTVYQWASELKDSDGATVVAHQDWGSDPAARLKDGFHEVNFAYRLASFANRQSKVNANQGGCLAYIGVNTGPKAFDLVGVRNWVGSSPKIDSQTGAVTATGTGLLGTPALAGAAQATLNILCSDKATGRLPGFFENDADEYDGGAAYDANQQPIDIGAYLHVVGAVDYIQNGYGNYTGNLAGMICGFVSNLDPKSSTTNKPLVGVMQRYKLNNAQLDALTAIGVNMLRFHGFNDMPRMTHGMMAAQRSSDYDRMVRQRVKFLVMQATADVADPFIGESTADGLQLQAMKTALDAKYGELKKKGYIGMIRFAISASDAQQKIGQASISITFSPAEELVQLRVKVGLSRT
jgi:hypothetical protein